MRADRASALDQWSLPLDEALQREGRAAYPILERESFAGAARSASSSPSWAWRADRMASSSPCAASVSFESRPGEDPAIRGLPHQRPQKASE